MLGTEGSQALLWKPWTVDLGALLGDRLKRLGPGDSEALSVLKWRERSKT